jgi:uncharacterized protein YlxP (DUF503 family)
MGESLKDKRSFTHCFESKLKSKFNVAISEIDDLNSVRFANFLVVSVSNSYNTLEKRLNNITEYINKTYLEVEIVELNRFNLI